MTDRSMSGWTEESLIKRANRDADSNHYDPPASWTPFTKVQKGTIARTIYDVAFDRRRNAKKRA